MSIITNLIISDNSKLSISELSSFEQQIKKGLTDCTSDKYNIYCNISVDGDLPDHLESQFSKINGNLYIGFAEGSEIDGNFQRAFKFKCIAIKDVFAARAKRIIIIISTKPIGANHNINNQNNINNISVENDKLPDFEATDPKYSLDRVILDDCTKKQINRAIALIRNQKLIYDTWGFKDIDPNTKTILCFFGAPGTGKTMCAHAIAKELGKKIMIASYASIESKWVGEGPKNMRKIFSDATTQDALLFFDEADSFLSKRVNNAETGSDKHYNRMSNEMFQLLEDFDGIVIFATNLVSDFDKAFKSRILSFIEFSLPDKETRRDLIKALLPSKLPLKNDIDDNLLEVLSDASDGFSGREIRKAILISLSDGALNGVLEFDVNSLIIGFKSVQQERSSIETTASQERNIISDFIDTTNQNKYIINICLWAISQNGQIGNKVKSVLYKICRLLNCDMPDLSLSYENIDLTEASKTIREADRVQELIIYFSYLVSYSQYETELEDTIITHFCEMFDSIAVTSLKQHINSIKYILNQ